MSGKWTARISRAWSAVGHALNVYAIIIILSGFVSGAAVLGLLYGFAGGYAELHPASQVFFAGAIFGAMLLLSMIFAPWLWEHRPLKVRFEAVPPRVPVRLPALAATEVAVERIELTLDELNYREQEPWVHLRVINKGSPDEFKAEVTSMWYAEGDQKQYTMKWREGDEAVRRVFKDDLVNVAQIVPPAQTNPPIESWPADSTLEAAAREGATFDRGYFRLFSVVKPNGWTVYGKRSLVEFLENKSTVPPAERPLLVFDERLELKLRVMGSRGQHVSGRIRLGFQRPDWNYDRNTYESWRPPTATLHLDGATMES